MKDNILDKLKHNPTSFLIDEKTKIKEVKKYQKFVEEYVSNIDSRYNQGLLLEYLLDEDKDYFMSISNRADGKTSTYIHFFIKFAIKFNIKLCIVVRHHDLMKTMQNNIHELFNQKWNDLDGTKVFFARNQEYIEIIYNNTAIAILIDLNNADDLKNISTYLKKYPIILYDEFLALESSYLPDEVEKMATIYQSINRDERIPYITFPKIFMLGNAVNFSSPFLSYFEIFDTLETHEINTIQQYDTLMLEMLRNDQSNEQRNIRAFKNVNNAMDSGQFNFNKYNISTRDQKKNIMLISDVIYVKVGRKYLKIIYNKKTYEVILSIINFNNDYQFNTMMIDNTDTSVFLKDSFFNVEHEKKHEKGLYLYENSFSKEYIMNDPIILQMKIMKIIGYYEEEKKEDVLEENIRIRSYNHLENTKRRLFEKFELGW